MEENVVGEQSEDLLGREGGEARAPRFNRGIDDEESEEHSIREIMEFDGRFYRTPAS